MPDKRGWEITLIAHSPSGTEILRILQIDAALSSSSLKYLCSAARSSFQLCGCPCPPLEEK
uniref:Uncharacterized protein n=1 Tax=uncultured marine virus TaxID=186617 RepID=A0A0F7L550_9VIRU|nr:hypothetical protein [uncultured marine virus]